MYSTKLTSFCPIILLSFSSYVYFQFGHFLGIVFIFAVFSSLFASYVCGHTSKLEERTVSGRYPTLDLSLFLSLFFPLFTCDILISTDHFPLLLFSIILSLSRIYTRVLFYLSGQSCSVCVCVAILSRIKLNGAFASNRYENTKC